jgi:hypothetical protein
MFQSHCRGRGEDEVKCEQQVKETVGRPLDNMPFVQDGSRISTPCIPSLVARVAHAFRLRHKA